MRKTGNPVPSFTNVTTARSKGSQATKLYKATGQQLLEWQQKQIEGLMSVDDAGLWKYMDWCLSLSRRNGKGEILAARELWGILAAGEKVLHTAHRTTTSHDAYERLHRLLILGGFEERPKRTGGRPGTFYASKQYGLERIEVFGRGQINFRTRTDSGGLGEGFDVLVIDEAQEYTSKQQSALTYTVSASKNPQTIYTGTPPTAISRGEVFGNLRNDVMAGKAADTTGWTEWSIEQQTEDIGNTDLWYRFNPSLGLILTERTVKRETTAGAVDFNIQRLGLWLSYKQEAAISPAEWNEGLVDDVPDLEAKRYFGVKYGVDGTNVALSVAAKTKDGKVYVEYIDHRPIRDGTAWMIEFFKNPKTAEVAVDGANGQQIIADAMKEAKVKAPVLPTVKQIIAANAMFEVGIRGTLQHVKQKTPERIITNCERRAIGSNGGFGYKAQIEDVDIAVMDSMILAHWQAATAKKQEPQKIKY